ncbi:SDR family oxidoreductase [Deltaproteobacteria bacterium TL4]
MATNNKPQILLTGAGGELAHHVSKKLAKDYEIVGVDFRSSSHYDDQIVRYRLDYSKRGFEDVFRKHQFDGIIHIGRIRLTETDRFKRYNVNVLGSQKLMELANKYKVPRVLILSTFHVYGAHPYNPSLLDETFPLKASNLSSELVDSVELENLIAIARFRFPDVKFTVLRPCNIVGPGVNNQISTLLASNRVPVLIGFSPLMQFIHVNDVAEAMVRAYKGDKPGVYNVAPDDWVPYTKALELAGVKPVWFPSVPPALTERIFYYLNRKDFPSYMVNFFKYAAVLDGTLFNETFGFRAKYTLSQIFSYYLQQKKLEEP